MWKAERNKEIDRQHNIRQSSVRMFFCEQTLPTPQGNALSPFPSCSRREGR
jgi:hypothetical protein